MQITIGVAGADCKRSTALIVSILNHPMYGGRFNPEDIWVFERVGSQPSTAYDKYSNRYNDLDILHGLKRMASQESGKGIVHRRLIVLDDCEELTVTEGDKASTVSEWLKRGSLLNSIVITTMRHLNHHAHTILARKKTCVTQGYRNNHVGGWLWIGHYDPEYIFREPQHIYNIDLLQYNPQSGYPKVSYARAIPHHQDFVLSPTLQTNMPNNSS